MIFIPHIKKVMKNALIRKYNVLFRTASIRIYSHLTSFNKTGLGTEKYHIVP